MHGGGSTPLAIEAQQLARRFGPRWALAGIDLAIPKGAAWMLTGANGSGKTTLLRCLATALYPHQGELRILGEEVKKSADAVRQKTALISHASRLYEDLGPRDNLRMWARLGGFSVDVEHALAEVGLEGVPENPVRTFSAGMQRRVAFAIAFLKPAALLLLDEPFAALDPAGRTWLKSRLAAERQKGTTLVIATHLPSVTGPLCDWAIHLDNGAIQWQGTPNECPVLEREE